MGDEISIISILFPKSSMQRLQNSACDVHCSIMTMQLQHHEPAIAAS